MIDFNRTDENVAERVAYELEEDLKPVEDEKPWELGEIIEMDFLTLKVRAFTERGWALLLEIDTNEIYEFEPGIGLIKEVD